MATTDKRRRTKKSDEPTIIHVEDAGWGQGLFGRLTEPEEYDVLYPGTYSLKSPYQKITFKQDPYAAWFEGRQDPGMNWRTLGETPYAYRLQRYPDSRLLFPKTEQVLNPAPVTAISDRVNLLLGLVGEAHVVDALRPLETSTDREVWSLLFVEVRPATVREYIAFLSALNHLYELFLSVLRVEYFVNSWVKSKPLEVSAADELRVISISKNSPENIKVEGLAAGLKAVGDALSIGDQLQKIRTAGVKVDEAKLELKKKELELAEAERQAKIRASGTDMDMLLEVEKKHVALDALRRKSEEEELKLKKMKLEYFGEAFDTLSKTLQLLERMPPSLKASFEQLLQQKIDELLVQPPYHIQSAERVAIGDGKSRTA